jgi:hypothetical protein
MDVLYLRIIYPCSFDGDSKCFFQKMMGRSASVKDAKVSLTVIPDLFPLIPTLVEDRRTGIVNFVNRGSVHLKQLFEASMTPYKVAEKDDDKINETLSSTLLCKYVGQENVPFLEQSIQNIISAKLLPSSFKISRNGRRP